MAWAKQLMRSTAAAVPRCCVTRRRSRATRKRRPSLPAFRRSSPASKKILTDLLIETRINNSLAAELGAGLVRGGIEVIVDNGEVVLAGATTDPAALERAHLIATRTPGVRRVENNVTLINAANYTRQ